MKETNPMNKLIPLMMFAALAACDPDNPTVWQGEPGETGEQGEPGARGSEGPAGDAIPVTKDNLYFVVVRDDTYDEFVDITARCAHESHVVLHGGCSSAVNAARVSMPDFPTNTPPGERSGWRCEWHNRDEGGAASVVMAFATCYQPQ